MAHVFKSSLLAGLATGFVSVLPLIGWLNFLCCFWVIAGGVFGVFLYNQFSGKKADYWRGAKVGFLTAIFAFLIYFVINLGFSALYFMSFQDAALDSAVPFHNNPIINNFIGQNIAPESALLVTMIVVFLIGMLLNLIFYILFGILGGILGVSFFGNEKKKKNRKRKTV